jgi:hypothetical protein
MLSYKFDASINRSPKNHAVNFATLSTLLILGPFPLSGRVLAVRGEDLGQTPGNLFAQWCDSPHRALKIEYFASSILQKP